MNSATRPLLELRLPTWRSRLVLLCMIGGFAVLAGRAVYLQGLHNAFLQAKGEQRYSRVIKIHAYRGRITDRHGEVLAVSTPVKSIWVVPGEVKFEGSQLERLSALLGMSQRDITNRIKGASGDFVYLKRQIPPETAKRVAQLHIPGLFQDREYRRYYPAGEVMAQVLGFTGAGDVGQEGVELAYQSQLAGKPGSRRVIRDRLGHIVEDVGSIHPAQQGKNLTLSLDAKIQSLAFLQLKAAVTKHRAKAGSIVVLDANTGEILALANLPSYNPNNRANLSGAQLRNRAITDTFEPGSTLKPFTIAVALELGRVTPDTEIQTAPGSFTIGTATIHDAEREGLLTVAQVIQKSSNIGAAKIALSLPAQAMWQMFRAVGFGSPPRIKFPGVASGRVRPYRTWRPIEQATMAYGHGISVSLLQLAHAYTIFAHDGEIVPLSLTRVNVPGTPRRVISARTAREVRRMLELVVQVGGTAPRAQIMGYRVAGKTGTSRKEENGVYVHKYVASFVGFAPASRPRLVIAVMIDQPSDGQYYGGQVAAPVFARVMQGALRLMDVPPDAPMAPIKLPAPGQEVKENA